MNQQSIYQILRDKGYVIGDPLHDVLVEFMTYYINYDFSLKFISGSIKEEIESSEGPGFHLLLEPIVLPSVSNALFIAMYGDLEFYLNQICLAYRKKRNLNLHLTDMYGLGVNRSVTYLSKVVGIKGLKESKEWSELKHWNKIRNSLVHHNGILKSSEEIYSAKHLKLGVNEKYNKVYLTTENCDSFQTIVVNFIKQCI